MMTDYKQSEMCRVKEEGFVEKEFPWYIDPALKKKLDIMIQCLKTDDAWLVIDGDEGAGKSTMAAFIMYYVHCKTGRALGANNFFFDAESMFHNAKYYNGLILNWDEAALGGLSRQWQNKNQMNLMQLGMTGRIKHHFIVLCIPKADKLGEYFVRDRTLGLIHVYKRHGIHKGRYLYLNKRAKEKFWEDYRRSRRRRYASLKSFRGTFPNCFSKIIDEEIYNQKKMDAISKIGTTERKLTPLQKNDLLNKQKIALFLKENKLMEKGAKALGKTPKCLYEWARLEEDKPPVPLFTFNDEGKYIKKVNPIAAK